MQDPNSYHQELIDQLDYLKRIAYNFTKNEQNAQDLVQEVILRAIKYKDKFQEKTNLQGWLYTITRNTFLNANRRVRMNVVQTWPDLWLATSSAFKVESRAVGEIQKKEIQAAVENLPPSYKKPLKLHFDGYQYEEIAEKLEIPLGTVKNRIHRARKLLKNNLLPE